ncbi:MAG: SH3 domain-containing protein [Tissierellia bacterium]|nr:SH3 domain-containing protein [Tissierellia bacterium]
MKKRIYKLYVRCLFLIFIKTFYLFAQSEYKVGQIKDPDGYTNIRKEANVKSQIIGKILEDEYFFYQQNDSNWYKITKQNGIKGFIHRSRIKKENTEYLLVVKVEDYESNMLKDSILDIRRSHRENSPPFYIRGFNYPEVKKIQKDTTCILFCDKRNEIKINKRRTNKNEYKFKTIVIDNREYIDILPEKGFKIRGVDIEFPTYELDSIDISIEGNQYSLPKSEIKYLFEPNIEETKVFRKENTQYIIYLSGGDGVASYYAIYIVGKEELVGKCFLEN